MNPCAMCLHEEDDHETIQTGCTVFDCSCPAYMTEVEVIQPRPGYFLPSSFPYVIRFTDSVDTPSDPVLMEALEVGVDISDYDYVTSLEADTDTFAGAMRQLQDRINEVAGQVADQFRELIGRAGDDAQRRADEHYAALSDLYYSTVTRTYGGDDRSMPGIDATPIEWFDPDDQSRFLAEAAEAARNAEARMDAIDRELERWE